MEIQIKYQTRIVRPKPVITPPTKLWVPHGGGEIAFAYPSQGPTSYQTVGKAILDAGQLVPHGDYTASLLAGAYLGTSKDKLEFQNVREIMRNRWLWVFNRNLWAENGFYSLQDTRAIGRSKPLNIRDLEKRLKGGKEISGVRFSKDRRVRFAPKGSYRIGEHTPESLAKDGFVIASYGKEGAEKLGEVADTFRGKPITYGLEIPEGQEPEQRVSAVDDYVDRLHVDGSYRDGSDDGHAFGVLK